MPRFPVSQEKENDLLRRMERCGLREGNIIEEFARGGGAGGQKINKTSVAVRLHHPPSGLDVRCQESRSQALNRFLARRLLTEKMEALLFREESERQREFERLRRQKRKRSRRAKEKILGNKRRRADIKRGRQRPECE